MQDQGRQQSTSLSIPLLTLIHRSCVFERLAQAGLPGAIAIATTGKEPD